MTKRIDVSFASNELMSVPHTRWISGNLIVVHDDTDDRFICCVKKTGEILKETGSLRDAINWLTADQEQEA